VEGLKKGKERATQRMDSLSFRMRGSLRFYQASICHTHMALVGICLLHAPTTTSPFFSSAGQIMSLLLVTTGATSALLVNRGLSAPTFVSLCNYLMLGAYACESGLFSLLFVAV
jgi:hypothetical protein